MFSQDDCASKLLEVINQENCDHRIFGLNTLLHYADPYKDRNVNSFDIRKKHGGKRRIVRSNKPHSCILKKINEILQVLYEPEECACGFIPGKSLVDNARPHVGKKFILCMDIQDFFPSITRDRIERVFREDYQFPVEANRLLSGLCCGHGHDEILDYIPQGFPTSPTLSNMVCQRMDHDLMTLANENHLCYTRYADDITFSSDEDILRPDGMIALQIRYIVLRNGFRLNDRKTHLQMSCRRQDVTGIVVNEKLNLSRRYIREIRDILYIWSKYGYEDAQQRVMPHYRSQHGKTKGHDDLNLVHILYGKLQYLKMVRGAYDPVYLRMMEKYHSLVVTIKPVIESVVEESPVEPEVDDVERQAVTEEFHQSPTESIIVQNIDHDHQNDMIDQLQDAADRFTRGLAPVEKPVETEDDEQSGILSEEDHGLGCMGAVLGVIIAVAVIELLKLLIINCF